MGIKSIKKLLSKKCKKGIYKTNINQFANQIVFIDTSIFMYKFKYQESFGYTNTISLFTKMISLLTKYNITPIFVFDGKPTDNKIVLQDRKEKKNKANKKIEKLKDTIKDEADKSGIIVVDGEKIESSASLQDIIVPDSLNNLILELEKTERQNIRVTWRDFEQLKYLLDSMGIKYIHAPYESDIVIPYIIKKFNLKAFCLSGDTDFLVHNVDLLANIDINSGYIEHFNIKELREELGLDIKEFVDMSIMMGCDYCKSLKGIGPMTAYKYIKEYKCLEECFLNKIFSLIHIFIIVHLWY